MTATGQAELASSVTKLDPYVSPGDAGLVLNAPENVLAEVPEEHLVELRAALAKKNTADQQEAATGEEGRAADAADHGYITSHWYGWELGMDSYLSGKVTAGLVSAGALATLVGASFTGPAAAIIAAGFTYIVGMVNVCKHENGWTYISLMGMPPFTAGTVVCNPFG